MILPRNGWKRETIVILRIGLMMAVFMIPMAGSADQPEDGVYKMADIDEPPRVIRVFPPKYPAVAKEEQIEGRIVVELVVTKEGIPKEPLVIDAEPPDIFEEAALEAVRQYQFIPGIRNGEAVDVMVRVPIVFVLNEKSEPFGLDPESKDGAGMESGGKFLIKAGKNGEDQEKKVSFDFVNGEIEMFINFIGELTGNQYVIDDDVKGKVSVKSAEGLSMDDLNMFFESFLDEKGYAAVPSGDHIRIMKK